jgi:malate permease and related proteins
MSVFLVTFQAVAALLGIGVLGFWIIGRRHIPENALGLLTSIAIDVALPCLILSNILIQFAPQTFPDWWHLPLWWLGFSVVAVLLSLLTSFLVNRSYRSEFAIGVFFQNGIFFPLIILTGLFSNPANYLVQLFLFIFLQASIVFATYAMFFKRPDTNAEPLFNWRRILNPVMVMTVFGLALGLSGIRAYVPGFLIMILTMVGAMATPLFMLILGGNVYNDFRHRTEGGNRIFTAEVIKFALVKNLLFPLVFLGLLIWLHPDYTLALIIILQAAVPPITAIPILSERAGGNRAIASQFVVASFVFSIISIPVVIYLFSLFFPFPV